jgi:hypothetical protein
MATIEEPPRLIGVISPERSASVAEAVDEGTLPLTTS